MRSLLIFILRFHAFFLFLILSGISIVLIYREKSYQRTAMINSANSVVGSVMKARSNFGDYFHLRKINDSLMAENARLRGELSNSWYLDPPGFILVQDSTGDSTEPARLQHYRYLPAKVIGNSVYQFNNHMTALAGSRHGVRRGMGVIGPNGVAGIIRNVEKSTSRAFSLLHHEVAIPAKLKRSADQGRVVWRDPDPNFAHLIDIGQHVKAEPGDSVVTSGFSTAFPAGIMIGTVEDYTVNRGTGFLDIRLRLSTDFRRLETVYIVENLLQDELQQLESGTP